MSFKKHRQKVQTNFDNLKQSELFQADINRDDIWQIYMAYWNQDQEYNCNCCKSFIRQAGGMVSADGETIWKGVIESLDDYVKSKEITGRYYHPETRIGTPINYSEKHQTNFEHFYLDIPRAFTIHKPNAVIQMQTLKRALTELKPEAVDTVLELIADNDLDRGIQHRKALLNLKSLFGETNYWKHYNNPAHSIRNSVIGTLLVDLSEGMPLNEAVFKYESKVDPRKYQRPRSLVTTSMVLKAQEKVKELGLDLERRHALETDLDISNLLFIDNSSKTDDPFGLVSEDVILDPKHNLEMSIEEFLARPKNGKLEVFVENNHLNNFFSLTTGPQQGLFKWDNPIGWTYTGGVADSLKDRVKAAGGKIDALLSLRLGWYNYDDLDLHCIEPNANRIYHGNKRSGTGGYLDVDMNVSADTREPVENIYWNKPLDGKYRALVHNYTRRESQDIGFEFQLEYAGETITIERLNSPEDNEYFNVLDFEIRQGKLILPSNIKSNKVSKTKWGIKTQTLTKVKSIMLSPNYWNSEVGNKHYFFVLEGCKSDESLRPFFNEYLNPNLNEHRKVLELVGDKVKVAKSEEQVSGLGFASSKRNHIIVKHDNQFIKVNI